MPQLFIPINIKSLRTHLLKTLAAFLVFTCSAAHAVPGTDISLFKILTSEKGIALKFEKTLVKRSGYDNQPAFSADSQSILYTKMVGEQTDIWQVQIKDGGTKAITQTKESEYSPTPLADKIFSSVIAYEGKQTLWELVGGKHHQLLSRAVEPVGYHVWTAPNQLAMFRLAEPHELVLLELDQGSAKGTVLAKDIGRGLAAQPSENLLFYTQVVGEALWLSQYDLEKRVAQDLLALFPNQQDFAWHSAIGFIHSDGESLYQSTREASKWIKLEVKGGHNLTQISRLAISPNGQWLAVVHADL